MFVRKKAAQMDYFAGGIVVGLEPYQFVAAGLYGKVKQPEVYDAAFVFAKLEGPLITLEFAEISGITGGFGYNSDVALPTINNIRKFPFIGGEGDGSEDASDSLLDYLGRLVRVDGQGFFRTRSGAMWLAAGLKVSALEMLDIDAVFVVSWSPSITLGIFGVAVANIPRAKNGSLSFARVGMEILTVVDLDAGVFRADMRLSPSSYIFHPSCRLTGGSALYYWFNDKAPEHKGE